MSFQKGATFVLRSGRYINEIIRIKERTKATDKKVTDLSCVQLDIIQSDSFSSLSVCLSTLPSLSYRPNDCSFLSSSCSHQIRDTTSILFCFVVVCLLVCLLFTRNELPEVVSNGVNEIIIHFFSWTNHSRFYTSLRPTLLVVKLTGFDYSLIVMFD